MSLEYMGKFIEAGTVYGLPCTPECIERARNMDFTPEDVLIVAYPKSGLTWLKYTTQLILNQHMLYEEHGSDSLLEDAVYLEFNLPIDKAMSKPPPRVFVSHLSYTHFKKQVQDKKCKVITITREVKDLLTSYYHFHRMNAFHGQFKGDFNQFFEFFKERVLQHGDPVIYNQEWWEARDNDNILYLKYEKMLRDLPQVIRDVARFLQRDITEDTVQKIATMTSFENMKTNNYCNFSQLANKGMMDFSISNFMRKGKTGDWKEHFTPEQVAFVNERLEETDVIYG